MRHRAKIGIYTALSVLLAFPLLIDLHFGATRGPKAIALWLVQVALLWSAFPAWRSTALRQATNTFALLIVANVMVSPLATHLLPRPAPTLQPNLHVELHVEGTLLSGLAGVKTITTNDHGHRTNGPVDYAHKPAGALRIVTIGASTTEDILQGDRQTWPSLLGDILEKKLGRKIEVINPSLSATRAPDQLEMLRDSEAYKPDIAIFMMGINDWDHAVFVAHDPLARFFDTTESARFFDSLLWRGLLPVRAIFSGQVRDGDQSEVNDGSSYRRWMSDSAHAPKIHFEMTEVDEAYRAAVGEMMAECARRKLLCVFTDQATTYVTSFPQDRHWMTPAHANFALSVEDQQAVATLYNNWMQRTAAAHRLPFCALAHRMPPTLDFFFDDCHFTDKGSELAASLISDCLLSAMDSPAAPRL